MGWLDEIKERRASITEGELWEPDDAVTIPPYNVRAWQDNDDSPDIIPPTEILGCAEDDSGVDYGGNSIHLTGFLKFEDADFVSHAPTDIDRLIQEIEILRKDNLGWANRAQYWMDKAES